MNVRAMGLFSFCGLVTLPLPIHLLKYCFPAMLGLGESTVAPPLKLTGTLLLLWDAKFTKSSEVEVLSAD